MSTRRRQMRFDPQSLDAQLATIIAGQKTHSEEMDRQFKDVRAELVVIREQAIKTNGRVTVLELWRETSKAKMAGMATVLGAAGGVATWLAGILLK